VEGVEQRHRVAGGVRDRPQLVERDDRGGGDLDQRLLELGKLQKGDLVIFSGGSHVGLYAADGTGDVIGVFCVPDDPPDEAGGGVSQLLWSACERYLYIAERRSDVVSVYDIRNTGLRVASLRRRAAATNQRMAVSLLDKELVGGGMDGMVRIWRGEEGGEPVGAWRAHDDVVTAAAVHPFGEIVATCSGSRKTFGLDVGRSSGSSSDEDTVMDTPMLWDNSLKIWEIPRARGPHSSAEDKDP